MQELTLMLIRFAYLAILWIFVFGAISVIRSDMFGARPDSAPAAGRREQRAQSKAAKRGPKKTRGQPSKAVVVDGSNSGLTVSLDDAPILIGRGPDAAIRLDDDYVSTRHARIGRSDDTWYVEDLGSTNGTYIGSRRLTQATAISLGARVRVGKTTIELKK
jgi:pSer/pThr/pTyr-binding forkhead associated (FHA) protein